MVDEHAMIDLYVCVVLVDGEESRMDERWRLSLRLFLFLFLFLFLESFQQARLVESLHDCGFEPEIEDRTWTLIGMTLGQFLVSVAPLEGQTRTLVVELVK